MSIQTPAMNKPCGCRGACDCSTNICKPSGSSGLLRPQFFAGQLLTEEDLQDLVQYVVDKQRLQNRYLHGDGVVCGLTVKCEANERKVSVSLGYALDCCGNDIVVPCDEEVDILQLVDELLRARHGKSCEQLHIPDEQELDNDMQPRAAEGGAAEASYVDEPPVHTYGLYLRYCEQPTAHVAPYAFDEPCSDSRCEPSRVIESYSFELRCPTKDDRGPSLSDLLCHRRKALGKYRTIAARCVHALATLEAGARITLKGQTLKDPGDLPTQLRAATQEIPGELTGDAVDKINAALAIAFRAMRFLKDENRAVLPALVNNLKSKLKLVGELPAVVKKLLEARIVALDAASASGFEGWARLTGEHLSKEMVHAALLDLESAREALLKAHTLGDICLERALRRSLSRISLRSFIDSGAVDSGQLVPLIRETQSRIREQAEIVCRAIALVTRQWTCNALLPPCPPCDDPAVLLAHVDVQECKVDRVCNLPRRTVISGPALNHWFCDFRLLHCLLEKFCCPSEQDRYRALQHIIKSKAEQREAWKQRPELVEPSVVASSNADAWHKLHANVTAEDRDRFAVIAPPDGLADLDEDNPLVNHAVDFTLAGDAGHPGPNLGPMLAAVRSLDVSDLIANASRPDASSAATETQDAASSPDESQTETVSLSAAAIGEMIEERAKVIATEVAKDIVASSLKKTTRKKTPRKKTAKKKATKKKATKKKPPKKAAKKASD